jgi:iron complex outermembrane receptor protein
MNMNNWVGDGNGYVGNLNLLPEVANTVSATGRWHDAAQQLWRLEVTPYYTRVDDYVDAVACSTIGKTCPARTDGFVNLSLANQAARLYGMDVSGQLALATTGSYGSLLVRGLLNAVNGKNLSTGAPLYNIMPLNVKLALEHHLGPWTNTLEVKWVDAKTDVQAVRKELATSAYSLLNLRSSYEWKSLRIDAGVENLLNASYVNPLGGAYVGQGPTMGTGVHQGVGVPGIGRSAFVAANVKF